MKTIGIIATVVIIGLYVFWLRFQRRQEAAVIGASGRQEVTVVVSGAYAPNIISVKRGVPVRMHFDRQEDAECSRFVAFPDLKIHRELQPFAVTDVEFTPDRAGELSFSCDMGMYQGKVVVEG